MANKDQQNPLEYYKGEVRRLNKLVRKLELENEELRSQRREKHKKRAEEKKKSEPSRRELIRQKIKEKYSTMKEEE